MSGIGGYGRRAMRPTVEPTNDYAEQRQPRMVVVASSTRPGVPVQVRVRVAAHRCVCGCDFIRVNGVLRRRNVCEEHRAELGL